MCGSGELSKRPSHVSSVSGRSWLRCCQWDQRCSIFCHLAIQQNHLESDHGLGDCTAVCLRSKDNVEVQDINHETEKQKSNDIERLLLTIRHSELPDRGRANMFAFALFRLFSRLPCFAKCLSVRMRYC